MKVSQKLYALRKKYGMKQEDIARIAEVSVSAVSGWEKESRSPKVGAISKLCDYFNVPLNVFIDPDNDIFDSDIPAGMIPMPGIKRLPLVGEIACGTPIIANAETEMISAPDWIHADCALKCKGDSMINARIFDGDIVYIRQQQDIEDGEIAAVQIDEEEVTLKRVRKFLDRLVLMPENPQYKPLVFFADEIENRVRIIGKAVAFTSAVV